ncbi:MAG: hypothetical protein GY868_05830, partial [Deltaproteobacteria bacterium]|nr:hypothetical protein [Deltaproteobacteria bacterium]
NINNGKAELKKADHLWGKDSHETEDILQSELGKDTRVACIGPSGEKLSLLSCIINNKGRAAGRSGLGAVMGSKKLKAIAVNGKQEVPVADKEGLKEARKKYIAQMKEAMVYGMMKHGGTAGLMEFLHLTGEAPNKNWGGAALVDFVDATPLQGPAVDELSEKGYGCWHCPLSCGGLMKAGTGKHKYSAGVHRPEYESLAGFGNMCLNDNLESVIAACDICNRYGVDTISVGTAVAFAIECYENGILTDTDTDGIKLNWGNDEAIVALTEKIVRREGLGDLLADGVKVASEKIGKGSDQFAIHVGGQEPGLHDPRANMVFGVSFLDATPGRHTQGNEGMIPEAGLPLPPYDNDSAAGRGEVHKIVSNHYHVMNSAGLCFFMYLCMNADHVHSFLNLVTGTDLSMDDTLKIGERINNLRQAFNIREGLTVKDFKIPPRILGKPPLSEGPTAGKQVDSDTMKRDYFTALDWDIDTGKPSKAKLLELGLKNVAETI